MPCNFLVNLADSWHARLPSLSFPPLPPVASHAAPRVVLTKIDGVRPTPPSIYRPRHALVFRDNSLRARDVFVRSRRIAPLILRDKSERSTHRRPMLFIEVASSIYAPARKINCIERAKRFNSTRRARRPGGRTLIVFDEIAATK